MRITIPRPLTGLAVALALALLPAPRALAAQEMGIEVGAQAPRAIAVETLDGAKADLGQLFGKGPVLIQFWAAWCSNCHELAPKVAATFYRGLNP